MTHHYGLLFTLAVLLTTTCGEETEAPKRACSCSSGGQGGHDGANEMDTDGHAHRAGAYAQPPVMYMPLMYAPPHWPGQGNAPHGGSPVKGQKGEPGGCRACPGHPDPQLYSVREGETDVPERVLNITLAVLKERALKGDLDLRDHPAFRGPQGQKGETGARGFPGYAGPPGPPGPPGQLHPDSLGRRLVELRHPSVEHAQQDEFIENRDGDRVTKVAFTVALTKSVGPLQQAEVLKFDSVTTNIGHAYDTHTGEFTAPVSGAYHFAYHALGQYSKPLEVSLKHNAKVVNSVHSRQTGGYTGVSNSAVLSLQKGDVVTLVLSPDVYFVYGESGHHTTFTGYLLYPE